MPDFSLALLLATEAVNTNKEDGFVSDDAVAALDSAIRTGQVWRMNIPTARHTSWVNSAAYSPDGDRIVTSNISTPIPGIDLVVGPNGK